MKEGMAAKTLQMAVPQKDRLLGLDLELNMKPRLIALEHTLKASVLLASADSLGQDLHTVVEYQIEQVRFVLVAPMQSR